jgi:hypothetical protein
VADYAGLDREVLAALPLGERQRVLMEYKRYQSRTVTGLGMLSSSASAGGAGGTAASSSSVGAAATGAHIPPAPSRAAAIAALRSPEVIDLLTQADTSPAAAHATARAGSAGQLSPGRSASSAAAVAAAAAALQAQYFARMPVKGASGAPVADSTSAHTEGGTVHPAAAVSAASAAAEAAGTEPATPPMAAPKHAPYSVEAFVDVARELRAWMVRVGPHPQAAHARLLITYVTSLVADPAGARDDEAAAFMRCLRRYCATIRAEATQLGRCPCAAAAGVDGGCSCAANWDDVLRAVNDRLQAVCTHVRGCGMDWALA